MATPPPPRIMRTKSLVELQDLLNAQVIRVSYHQNMKKQNDEKKNIGNDDDTKIQDKDIKDGLNGMISHKTYKMPLTFQYHEHKFLFVNKPTKDCKEIIKFHKSLEKHQTSIFERYGWRPKLEQRVEIDLSASLLGFAINDETKEVMAMISLFDVSDSPEKVCKIENELSLTVLPPFQRRHLATDLVRLAWNLFAHPKDECWIYVMNSRKSGAFWRKFKQWYPDVKFRLVRP